MIYYPKSPILSPKQKVIYDYIVEYFEMTGRSPSQNEISRFCYIGQNNVGKYLEAMDRKGYIVYNKYYARSIEVVPRETDSSVESSDRVEA